jgi:quaternary ammonium compound-resistance protein SugE
LRVLPVGTAYAVWTGIGAVGAFLIGVVYLGEAVTAARVAAVAMILAGIATMKLAGS